MKIEISKDVFILIDDEDVLLFINRRWHPFRNRKNGLIYVRGWDKLGKKKVFLHKEVMKDFSKNPIDHINGNTLDNRKCNLRICSTKDNIRNRTKHKNNTSGYKGVYKVAKCDSWKAMIGVDKKRIYLGRFKTKEEAALAYNHAAIKYFGEFANLNKL